MVPSIQGTLGLTPGWSDTTLDGRVFLQCLQGTTHDPAQAGCHRSSYFHPDIVYNDWPAL